MSSCEGRAFCLQRRAQELKDERKTVEGQMDMARNELKKTKALLKMLTDSKTVPLSFTLKRCTPPCVLAGYAAML